MRTMKTISALAALAIGGVALANDSIELLEQQLDAAKKTYDLQPNAKTYDSIIKAENALMALNSDKSGNNFIEATITESEPNDTVGTADAITLNADRGTGDLEPAGDLDYWEAAGAAVGDLLFVLMDSEVSATGSDTEMSVFENDGTTLIEFDDDSGDGLGSAVATTVPTAGSIFVLPNEFGNDGTIEPYNVFVATVAPGDVIAETEPNDTTGAAQPLPNMLGGAFSGDISGSDDVFSFEATAGDRIAVVVNNDPDNNATNAAVDISVIDTDGSTVLANEAPFSATSQNAAAGTAANTGTHYVQLQDGGGTESNYTAVVFINDSAVPVELMQFDID